MLAGPVEQLDLLERDSALDVLAGAVAEASVGRGRLVVVVGEAGVGKTTLIRRFCDEQPQSVEVFSGGCDPLFTPRPLGPLLAVADGLGGALVEAVAREAPPHDVVTALMHDLRQQTPNVLVLEDVHWADEATLDVIRLLARRLEPLPTLVIASLREDELHPRHPLRVVLGELATSRVVERLRLEPLSAEAVAQLARPSGVDADELYGKTGGNAFYVAEVLRAGTVTIPDTVRDAVLARVARLDDRARALLDVVATVSPSADMWLVEAMAGDLTEKMEDCLSSGMLITDDTGVAFRHELGRLAVYESIPPNRRLELHRRALASLADPPRGRPMRQCWHITPRPPATAWPSFATHRRPPCALPRWGPTERRPPSMPARFVSAPGCRFAHERSSSRREPHRATSPISTPTGSQHWRKLSTCRWTLGDRLGEGDALRLLSEFLWCPGRTARG